MIWVEPCAGAAAVALHLAGPVSPPVSWMGGKRLLASRIAALMVDGVKPTEVHLIDPGPWGWAWKVLWQPGYPALVAAVVAEWGDEEPERLWRRLASEPVPEDPVRRVAAWAVLQRGSFLSRPVVIRGDAWHTQGFVGMQGKTLATANLAANIQRLAGATETPSRVWQIDAVQYSPPPGAAIYIDPPYKGTTGYSHDLPRDKVIALAVSWAATARVVAISEREPLSIGGWHHVDLSRVTKRGGDEWLTMSRPPLGSVQPRQVGMSGVAFPGGGE